MTFNTELWNGQAPVAGGYTIDRSIRLNSADSAYLNRTPSSAGNRKTWTWAGWYKPTVSGGYFRKLFGSGDTYLIHSGTGGTAAQDSLYVNLRGGATNYAVSYAPLFRDFSAWYHIVWSVDTTQATAANRSKLYVNGIELIDAGAAGQTYPPQNHDTAVNSAGLHYISTSGGYVDGYLADIHFIDGQALDPTSFGEFDANGVWQPIDASGLTYGTNGFHLKFDNTADLGEDAAGSNDWTVNNISAGASVYFVNQGGTSLDSYIPSGFTNTQNPASIFTDDSNGVIVSAPTGGNWLRMKATSSTATVKWMTYDGSSGGPTITLSVNLDGSGGYITPSVTGSGSSSDPKIGTFSVSAGTSYYIRTNLTGSLNTSMVLYVTNLEGDDESGRDSLRDSPTNGDTADDTGAGGEVPGNYATWNPLAVSAYPMSFTNGNLDTVSGGQTQWKDGWATISPTAGKWYWEYTVNASSGTEGTVVGLATLDAEYHNSNNYIYARRANGGKLDNGTYTASVFTAVSDGDIVGFAYDADAQKLWTSLNGTFVGNPAAGTGESWSSIPANVFPYVSTYNDTTTANFGQRPFANTNVPSGYKALCTANLDDPTIADGSTAMDVALYTGNGSTQTISGLNFSPDFVWIKQRSGTQFHRLQDTVRGTSKVLYSNVTDPEDTTSNDITAFNSDGFSVGSFVNTSSATYAAWTWDGGSSTVSNTDGTITSSVRANASAGFSVVTYTGTGTAATVGHGLGVPPQLIIAKNRDISSNWSVYHTSLGKDYFLRLNTTDAQVNSANYWGTGGMTSTVFGIDGGIFLNTNTEKVVAYCFAPVEGYSAFGSYTGNGDNNGPFVYTGHRSRWILIKVSSTTGNWVIIDTERNAYNIVDQVGLRPNVSDADSTDPVVDIVSNGFKMRKGTASLFNSSGATYVWASFAENPFKYARAR